MGNHKLFESLRDKLLSNDYTKYLSEQNPNIIYNSRFTNVGQSFLGFSVIVSNYVPRDQIIIADKHNIFISEFNYPSLVYHITEDFLEAVQIIKNYYIDRMEHKVDYLIRQIQEAR